MIVITSLKNPHVKQLVRLRDRRHRDRTGTFLIEGFREVDRALAASVDIEHLFFSPELFLGSNEPALIERARLQGAEVVEMAAAPFQKVSYRDRPEGLLAVAKQFPTTLETVTTQRTNLVLVVEAIEKPGNLGTMLRTADATGVDLVLVCDPTTDIFNPNVVRASTGVMFEIPIAVAGSADTVAWLRDRSVKIVATTPDTSLLHWDADLRCPVAVVIGTEQYGLTDSWLQAADLKVRIPMSGRADSLNAAMAAGVMLYEAARQQAQASDDT